MSDVALFGHLLGVLLFGSGLVITGVAFQSARRRERAAEVALLLGQATFGVMLVIPGGLVHLACGLWLVQLEDVGSGAGWVVAAIFLFAASLLLGGLGDGSRSRHAGWR
ncbi:MAG TPA: DUF2269 family protein [Solirubrobacterales bacterium]|nr:DUF2269 family protein [Solirubrobacterales bacterium]